MSKVLITGGLGYLGSNLAVCLLEQGKEVVIFDIAKTSKLLKHVEDKIKIVNGNLGDWADVLNAVKTNEIEFIYHLGAMITLPAEANPWAAYNTNANGTYHILEAARLFDVKCIVFPSGIATYSPPLPEVINEFTFQSSPNQIYGVTKILGERLGEYYYHKFGINFRCVSLPALCGPGRREGLAAYASLMVHEPTMGRRCQLPIDDEVQMPFIYIKDAVQCLMLLGQANESQLRRRVYSIQGFSLRAGDMATEVCKQIPTAEIDFVPNDGIVKLAHSMPKAVDDKLARQEWGWEPQYTWERAVKDFIYELEKNPKLYEHI